MDKDYDATQDSSAVTDAAGSENSTKGEDEVDNATIGLLKAYREYFGLMGKVPRQAPNEGEREHGAPYTDRNAGTPAASGGSDTGGPSHGGAADSQAAAAPADDKATGGLPGVNATEGSS